MRWCTMSSRPASPVMSDGPADEAPAVTENTVTWGALLRETEALLSRSEHSDNPRQEAKWILEEATGAEPGEFAAAMDELATIRRVAKLDDMVARRTAGEPIQYVLGSWAFRSLDLLVDQRVLIPRPETEVVAGLAIAELDRLRRDGGGTVVDLGTGSGAIGLSIAAERPVNRVLLTDVSADALSVARANLAGLGLAGSRVEIAEGSWFDAVPDRYRGECDVIVTNPPYVPTGDELAPSVVDWEPESALRAGSEGLDDLRVILQHAPSWLRPGGALVMEMAPEQTAIIANEADGLGMLTAVHADHAGLDRAVVARQP